MEHSLKPSYIQFRYHSSLAPHVATLPTRQWSPTGGLSGFGSFTNWAAGLRDVGDMVDDFVNVLLPKFHSSIVFDDWLLFNFDEGAGFFIPATGDAFTGKVGTDAAPGWFYAVQSIFTMFDTGFNTAKLSLLDTSSRGNFARRTGATADAEELAIVAEYTSTNNAWASRAGLRPATLRSISLGINDKLKKEYGLI